MGPSGVVLLTDRDADDTRVVIRRVGMRDRLIARMRAVSLDGELAAGADPDSRALLTLRAHRLLRPGVRKRLSRGLQRLIDLAHRPPRAATHIALPSQQILAVAPVIEQLAERLGGNGPLDVRGVALTQLLLTDPASPLFQRPSADAIGAALDEALQALTPRDAHDHRPLACLQEVFA